MLILLILLTQSLLAQTVFRISQGTLIGVNVLDLHSSIGKYERNPLLRDSFGRNSLTKGIILKGVSQGGLIVASNFDKKHRKIWTAVNFTISGVVLGVAIKNYRTPR
jgi:hypothetical protein